MSITYVPETANMDARIAHIFDDLTDQVTSLTEQLAERDQRISDLEDVLHASQTRASNLDTTFSWMLRLFRHPGMSATVKVVIFLYFWTVSSVRVDWRDKFELHLENMSALAGISIDTLRRVNKFLQYHQLATFTSEVRLNRDGEYRTHVSIELSDALASPELIEIQIDEDKRHGGKRTKLCSKCNHEVDVYTIHHCRHCDQVAWFASPGQSHDADVRQAQNAVAAQVAQIRATFDALNEIPQRDLPPVQDMQIDLPDLPQQIVTKGAKVPKDVSEDLNVLSSIFECHCGGCGRALQPIRKGGFEVYECPDCDKDLDRS